MLNEIKKTLIEKPDYIKEVLERYKFGNVKLHHTYISFGHDELSSSKSVVIWLENNKFCYVTDYSWNINKDIFSYIMKCRNVEFSNVLNTIKEVLHIDVYESYYRRKRAFGGWYDGIKVKTSLFDNLVQDENILDEYDPVGNLKFLKDGISLEAQRYFQIMFDSKDNGIVIPVRSDVGELMGVKIRCNYESNEDGFLKYWYKIPCHSSNTLYGYFQNYKHLVENKVFVLESEKGVMQGWSMGYKNCVGLASGSISTRQVQMLLELNPKEIVFLHDQGYGLDRIKRNVDMVKNYSRFIDIPVGYWDWTKGDYPNKVSPTDMSKEILEKIVNNEVVYG